MSLVRKFWIVSTLLVSFLIVSGLVFYGQIKEISHDLEDFLEVKEPLQFTAFELGVDLNRVEKAVLDSTRFLNLSSGLEYESSIQDFDLKLSVMDQLTFSPDIRKHLLVVQNAASNIRIASGTIRALENKRLQCLADLRKSLTQWNDAAKDIMVPTGLSPPRAEVLQQTMFLFVYLNRAVSELEGYISETGLRNVSSGEPIAEMLDNLLKQVENGGQASPAEPVVSFVAAGRDIIELTGYIQTHLERFLQAVSIARESLETRILPSVQQPFLDTIATTRNKAASTGVSLLLLALLGFLVALVTAGSVSRTFIRPLSLLIRSVDKFGQGDLAHRIDVENTGEFRSLAEAFNRMGTNLQSYREKLVEQNEKLALQMKGQYAAEERLKASELKYRSLVETTSDWIWEVDRNGVYTYVSPQVKTLLGYEPEEILGKTPFDLMPPEEAARVKSATQDLFRNRLPINALENIKLHRDGVRIVMETSGIPLIDEDGRLTGYRGIARGITERKRLEDERWEKQALFQAIFDQAAAGIGLTDLFGKIIKVNRKIIEIWGYPEEDLLGRYVQDIIHPDELDETLLFYESAIRGDDSRKSEQNRFIRKDGSVIWVELAPALIKSRNGEPLYLAAVVIDITERVESENRLRESEQRLRSVVRNASNAIAIYDTDMNYLFTSDRYLQDYSLEQADIIGRCVYDVVPEISPKWKDAHRRALEGETTGADCEAFTSHDGSQMFLRWQCFPLLDRNGDVDGIIFYSEIITDRVLAEQELENYRQHLEDIVHQRTEELEESNRMLQEEIQERQAIQNELAEARDAAEAANRAKSEFLANMSHEIRTPMNAIIGMTDLALGTRLSGEQRDFLTTVKASADSLLAIINDILDLSKIEAGYLKLENSDFNLRRLLEDILRSLAGKAHEKQLEINLDMKDDVPVFINGDPSGSDRPWSIFWAMP